MKPSRVAKAIVAAVAAGYAMFEQSTEPTIVDGTVIEAAGEITKVELYRIIGATVAAFGLVWGVPNAKAKDPAGNPVEIGVALDGDRVAGDGKAGAANV